MFHKFLWGDILTPTMMLVATVLINHDAITQYSPLVIVILSAIVFYGLLKLYRIFKDVLVLSLLEIPTLYFLLYTWIGLFNPPIEYARLGSRIVVVISLSASIHVIYSYLRRLRKGRG